MKLSEADFFLYAFAIVSIVVYVTWLYRCGAANAKTFREKISALGFALLCLGIVALGAAIVATIKCCAGPVDFWDSF